MRMELKVQREEDLEGANLEATISCTTMIKSALSEREVDTIMSKQ